MFYLTMHSTHFIFNNAGHMVKDHLVREETLCHHFMDSSFRLTARELLYTPPQRYSTYHGLFYTSCGTLASTKNSSKG